LTIKTVKYSNFSNPLQSDQKYGVWWNGMEIGQSGMVEWLEFGQSGIFVCLQSMQSLKNSTILVFARILSSLKFNQHKSITTMGDSSKDAWLDKARKTGKKNVCLHSSKFAF
jgi:hypothetical protein